MTEKVGFQNSKRGILFGDSAQVKIWKTMGGPIFGNRQSERIML